MATVIPKRKFALEEKDLAVEADENNKKAEEKENRFLKKIQEDATPFLFNPPDLLLPAFLCHAGVAITLS